MPTVLQWLRSQLIVSLPKPTAKQTGKTVLITGSNTGLGKEAARHFVSLGASTVILAVRSLEKGAAAQADIEASTGIKNVIQVRHLDMSSNKAVLDFVDKLEREVPRLDIAVLNAGVSRRSWEINEADESTIHVNVVATFLLALGLLPKLKTTAANFNTRPTLAIVASEVHYWARFTEWQSEGSIFEALSAPKDGEGIDLMNRYMVSKLLEVLCIRAIEDRRPATQIPVTINTLTPGFCHSELGREDGFSFTIFKFLFARTTEQGSRTLVHAGCAGAETHGEYLSDCEITKVSDWVLSPEGYRTQTRLWEELVQKLERIRPGITGNL